ncbi:hypothetical protein [Tamlana sp. I1]|uniref:hypothetical protein n=1 Tax=Tamlana sp. I1 TaxID=2762061 RepID=UPI00188FD590|nr:hypothetical protein [Tamlana sp. I1]
MKINLHLVFIFLFFFSVGYAQKKETPLEVEATKTESILKDVKVDLKPDSSALLVNELKMMPLADFKKSDIRLYFNRQKKVRNITIVFPKMIMEALA